MMMMIMRGGVVPCLRRVSQLAYANGVDEDSETMLSFALDSATSGSDGDEEWVATHTSKGTSFHSPFLHLLAPDEKLTKQHQYHNRSV